MITYTELKDKLKQNKQRVVFALASIIIFLLGFGTGRGYTAVTPPKPANLNYYTKQAKTPAPTNKTADKETEKQTESNSTANKANTATGTVPKPGQPCPIKGNISSSSKIYHVKGGAFYDRTTPEQCFNTEAEAQAAGFRKSSR